MKGDTGVHILDFAIIEDKNMIEDAVNVKNNNFIDSLK